MSLHNRCRFALFGVESVIIFQNFIVFFEIVCYNLFVS